MFWIQLYGKGQGGGKMHVEPVGQPFFDLKPAIAKAQLLAAKTTCQWGKPEGFRIIDETKALVHEAPV